MYSLKRANLEVTGVTPGVCVRAPFCFVIRLELTEHSLDVWILTLTHTSPNSLEVAMCPW